MPIVLWIRGHVLAASDDNESWSLMAYRVVQPYGRKRGEWTLLSEHDSARDGFDGIDALRDRMQRTGAPSDAIEWWMTEIRVVRPGAQ